MKLKTKFVLILIKTDDSVIMILSNFVNLGCVYEMDSQVNAFAKE